MDSHRYVITYTADGDVTGIADIVLPAPINSPADLPAAAEAIEDRYGVRNVQIVDYREERR